MNLRELKRGKKRSRIAVSEVMGAIVLLGVTLAVGFAAWAWVSGAARFAEVNLGSAANENFKVISANFTGTKVSLEIYDVQAGKENITAIVVTNSTSGGSHPLTYLNTTLAPSQVGSSSNTCKKCATLTGQTITVLTVNVGQSFTTGCIYTFKVTGQYGTTVQYQQVR